MPIAVPWRPLLVALAVALVGTAGVLSTSLVAATSALGGLAGYLLGAVLVAAFWRRPGFGAANAVTLARVVGTSWVLALMLDAGLGEAAVGAQGLMIIIGSVCLVLDGVDGYVARRRQQSSAFGARFDMETDAALLLVLSLAVVLLGAAGWWVLAIGGMRYIYVMASWAVPALRTPLPYRYSRKVVAVLQGVALLAALTLALVGAPPAAVAVVLLAALASLGWSFGRDVAWQLRVAHVTT